MEWLAHVIGKIRASGARKVFVQAPEGLKTRLLDIGSAMESSGIEAVLSCEPCYGACDLRDAEAKRLGCELLLHIGHAGMGAKAQIPVIYEEYRMDAEPVKILQEQLNKLEPYKSIGLLTTVQYIGSIEKAKRFLESKGKKVVIGNSETPAEPISAKDATDSFAVRHVLLQKEQRQPVAKGKAQYPGQVLGCDQSAAKSIEGMVDAFLFMGTGKFHATGLTAATEKPVLFLDFETGSISELSQEKERFERIRFANLEKAKNCSNFGVIISTKPGQANYAVALRAKEKLESKGRRAWILAMDAIAPEKLLGLKVDCLVNCACPRLNEDAAQFKKPIINPEDIDRL